jgi:hypothetical protein
MIVIFSIGGMSWCRSAILIGVIIGAALLVSHESPASAQMPAGTANAVLSFIDAAGGHVSVLRHWHGVGGQDMQVFPYTPYFWNSCLPGDGAIMILLTSPVGYPPPGLKSVEAYTSQYASAVGRQVAQGLQQVPQWQSDAQLKRIISGLATPGDPAYETLKAGVGSVNSLSAYEDYGYATFMMIRWEWRWPFPGCYSTVTTVPEGYGIPFVSLVRSERTATAQAFRFPAIAFADWGY